MRHTLFHTISLVAILIAAVAPSRAQQGNHHDPPVVYSESFHVGTSVVQVDFSDGVFEIPRSEVVTRIRAAATAVARFYGRFPVSSVRVLVVPVAGRAGVLQGTSWGDMGGFSAFLRIRIGTSTSHEQLTNDWIITHELVHTALSSLPDDNHWLEEGLASYIEPIIRVQAGEMSPGMMWSGMVKGMPNGEPESDDRGLDNTHTWGRTYWGGALFCLMADLEIRKQTQDRMGLEDALRAIAAAGDTINTEVPLEKVLATGDRATHTQVLASMYARWSRSPVNVDLPHLWEQLGIRGSAGNITFDGSAPLSSTRLAITRVAKKDTGEPKDVDQQP